LTNTHRALDDAILTIKLFEKLILKFKKLENNKKDLLNFIFSKSNSKAFFYCKKLFGINDEVINNEDFIKKTLEIV
jgi:DNA polymerase III epsilon subunit-like protein